MEGEEVKRLIENGDYIKLHTEYHIRYLLTDSAKDLERENGPVRTLFRDSKVKLYELRPEKRRGSQRKRASTSSCHGVGHTGYTAAVCHAAIHARASFVGIRLQRVGQGLVEAVELHSARRARLRHGRHQQVPARLSA